MNPSRSVLLSSTLRPHGPGAKPRPIFPGSNDQAYKVLAEWANHLAAPKQGDEAARREATRGLIESDEVFAVDRNRSSAVQPTECCGCRRPTCPRATRQKPGTEWSGHQSRPVRSPGIPDPVCSLRREAEAARTQELRRRVRQAIRQPAANRRRLRPAPSPSLLTVPDDDDDDDDRSDDMPEPPKKKAATGAAKAQAKPLTIDPKLLERALQYRNANRANPGS